MVIHRQAQKTREELSFIEKKELGGAVISKETIGENWEFQV